LNGSTNVDRLTDFDVVNDKIVLYYRAFWTFVYADNFNSVLPLRQFHVGASATTSSHRIVYNPTTGALLYDRDGTGPIPAVRFAILPVGLAVTNLNFLVFPRYLR
jgi:Ca2+-binding RTX toxin-like protein